MRRGTLLEKDRILEELDAWKPGTGESVIISKAHCARFYVTYKSSQCRKACGNRYRLGH